MELFHCKFRLATLNHFLCEWLSHSDYCGMSIMALAGLAWQPMDTALTHSDSDSRWPKKLAWCCCTAGMARDFHGTKK
jgi:hypothetical protein